MSCDSTHQITYRKQLDVQGIEGLLYHKLQVALNFKQIAKKVLSQITLESTLQEKAILKTIDCKPLERVIIKMVEASRAYANELKQNYAHKKGTSWR